MLHIFTSRIFTITLLRNYGYPHFTEKETEAKKGEVICPKSPSLQKSTQVVSMFLNMWFVAPRKAIPELLLRGLGDTSYFHNSIKTLFASFTVLTFTLVDKTAEALVQIMTVVLNYTSSHSILHSHVLTVRQAKPVSLKNVLDLAVKNLLISMLKYRSFESPVWRNEMCLRHFCCLPKYTGCFKEKHSYDSIVS